MPARSVFKQVARLLATIAIVPSLVSFRVRTLLVDRDRAFESSTHALALIPGLTGQYMRRAFLARTLRGCDASAVIAFGTVLSRADAWIGAHVYIGPHCDLGLVEIEHDALIAAGVHIPSGPYTHGTADLDVPIREQGGSERLVRIGAGAWIGNNAVVLADVGRGAIVGAGAVVTRPVPDHGVAVGVPARVVRVREVVAVEPAGG